MEHALDLNLGLGIWVGSIIVIVIIQRTRKFPSVGLVYAYLVGLWLIHWPAALLYTLPWYWNEDVNLVRAGFTQSLYGVVAFTVGVVSVRVFWQSFVHTGRVRVARLLPRSSPPPLSVIHGPKLPTIYVVIGLVSSLLLSPIIGRIPTVNALISVAGQLVVVGLCLACWQAWQAGNYTAFMKWLLAAFALPFITIVIQGFLGFGVFALISVLAFISSFVRLRPRVVAIAVLLAYIGLSFYIGYMRDRNEIRLVVWGGQSLEQRIARVYETTTSIEWFNPWNLEHLRLIDIRLNQNVLVGASVFHLSAGYQEYARGATLQDAVIAVVPRIIWPDKPVRAGGNALVTAYTGIPFAAGTTVGIGQVMEFYINFGTVSVILGFFVFGILISVFDLKAARHLHHGNLRGFTFWFLPGLGFMAAGDSLVVVVASVAAGFVVASLVNWWQEFAQSRREGMAVISPKKI
jgi:hypothetical protein